MHALPPDPTSNVIHGMLIPTQRDMRIFYIVVFFGLCCFIGWNFSIYEASHYKSAFIEVKKMNGELVTKIQELSVCLYYKKDPSSIDPELPTSDRWNTIQQEVKQEV
jgi:hypothetical protein